MRGTDYEFVDSDSDEILTQLIAKYEKITGRTLRPADPDRLFISWVADIISGERVLQNYTGNQNIPSRATGGNLDALGAFIYGITRKTAEAATCTVKFTISAAQTSALIIPSGTRVTDTSQTLIWDTTADAIITAGSTEVTTEVQCETEGTAGNGYSAGQINTLIDVDNVMYFSSVANTTESYGGADEETDDEYYERLRDSIGAYSAAGSAKAYEYWAKSVSDDIADVYVSAGTDEDTRGYVTINAIMNDGTIADAETKAAIESVCRSQDVRPLTDFVQVLDPTTKAFKIKLTYYIPKDSTIPATEIADNVAEAVAEYKSWQCRKMGRDINPSKLWQLLMTTGVSRITLSYPAYTAVADGVAPICSSVSITNGGYDDE